MGSGDSHHQVELAIQMVVHLVRYTSDSEYLRMLCLARRVNATEVVFERLHFVKIIEFVEVLKIHKDHFSAFCNLGLNSLMVKELVPGKGFQVLLDPTERQYRPLRFADVRYAVVSDGQRNHCPNRRE